jgi:hypothetical protein
VNRPSKMAFRDNSAPNPGLTQCTGDGLRVYFG